MGTICEIRQQARGVITQRLGKIFLPATLMGTICEIRQQAPGVITQREANN